MAAKHELVALAIFTPHEGQEAEVLRVLADLYTVLRSKGYSRDLLFRDRKHGHRLLNLRYWASEEARRSAHEDPDVHRFWATLGNLCTMEVVYEVLDPLATE